jgi:hypothetical protein
MRFTALRRLLPLSAPLLLAAAAALEAQQSRAMAVDCRGASAVTPENRQRTELWVRERLPAFVPSPDHALRMQSLIRQAEQVKLAFHSISSTCAQYLAGTMEREAADRALHGFERIIGNFIHDVGNDATVLAAQGQVADMGGLRQAMTDIGATGRQAALMGDEALAENARKKLVDALVSFSRTFTDGACYDQAFDPRIAMGLHRQNEILGTGIDVTPCARRLFTADGTGADIVWRFRHCGSGVGEWKIQTSGPLLGSGVATLSPDLTGLWQISENTSEGDVLVQYKGDMTLVQKPVEGEPDLKVPDRLLLQVTEGTVTADGEVFHRGLSMPGLTFAVKKSDKPCREDGEQGAE